MFIYEARSVPNETKRDFSPVPCQSEGKEREKKKFRRVVGVHKTNQNSRSLVRVAEYPSVAE
jgi:hypothetical protein